MACSENGSVTPETCAENIATCTRVALENGLPGPTQYKFENSAHQAIREPFDYYQFGVDFFRPAMDLENSVVLGKENFEEAFEFMKKGENVVFLANHQSEADPQVFSILLEKIGRRREAEELVYVAGHKVTTDPLAIPFSMGRNLLCIHSKKHINVDPTTKESKTQQNVATMNQMLKMMRGGGVGIWVAPSGGRDRRDVDTCEVPVAPFDQKTIDMFRLMGSKSENLFSILLEKIGRRREAEELVYVAGHKVTTDPLAIPFSMGRNLLCIHSKKHINVDPTTKESKTQQNVATMNQMLKMMRGGGVGIWVAPSGGRDRRDVDTCEVPVAPFDQKTIDMFRLMGSKSKTPTHFYSLAMVSYELCPPPDTVEAGVGEQRNIRYTPIGIACGEELPNVGGKESRHLFAQSAMEICEEKYFETMKEIDVLVKKSKQ
eukprot:CAMPEP_0171323856 /NCGR_PEP_ID=MMETSP0816-20121228/115834_1 /TAXON_ID=420281 /ORGANISM="Proboscia inermis, Strain CCAP1064/1" /LENGTH=431 /DNA_ID=CAMNT_0011822669 /DNA_START=46 /DNA_END=1340 /DNA_ORIENTATION=-